MNSTQIFHRRIICPRSRLVGVLRCLSLASIGWMVCMGLSSCLAQEGQPGPEADARSTSSQAATDQPASKRKPKPEPFQWVNPLRPADRKLPGLEHGTFASPSLKTEVGYGIYLPSAYHRAERSGDRFPVVYYLHGGRPGNERKSVRLVEVIHQQIEDGNVPPMIYVFVNGGPVSHYNLPDRPDAQGADVFIQELIPHIDSTYRTVANRSGRGLEGFSQGGRGTARLMFRYPSMFCSASPGGGGHATEQRISKSGGFESEKLKFAEGDNTWDLARLYAEQRNTEHSQTPELKILVHVGDKGFNYSNNLQWMEHLSNLGIEHQKIIVPGAGHSAMEIYRQRGRDIMAFHAKNFGLMD